MRFESGAIDIQYYACKGGLIKCEPEIYGLRGGLVRNSHVQRILRPPIEFHGERGCP